MKLPGTLKFYPNQIQYYGEFMYNYNSKHKIITAILVIGLAVYHFSTQKKVDYKYEDGSPIRTGEVVDGLREGQWTWYHKNGKKQLSGRFFHGNREGEWLVYDTLENVILRSNYHENLLDGEQIVYGSEGNVLQVNYYEKDKLVGR